MAKKTLNPPTLQLENADQNHLGLERLVFFSDAVFAIAITLLAIEIRLPSTDGLLSDADLAQALLNMAPKYLGYAISFLVVGSFWMSHHRKFRFIQRYDRRLMVINLLLLMVIGFMPFLTSVVSEYGNRTATIFYAVVIAVMGILSALLWWYASFRNRLIDPQLDLHLRRRELLGPLIFAGIFLASIGLAFINADLAKFSWTLALVAWLFIR